MLRNVIFILLLLVPIFSQKTAGRLRLEINESEVKDILSTLSPIYFKTLKNLDGNLYIEKFQSVRIMNDYIETDLILKGDKLSYTTSLLGKDIDVKMGDILFYLTFKVTTSFKNNEIKYDISIRQTEGRENSGLVSSIIIPVLNALISSKDSFISGDEIGPLLSYYQSPTKENEMLFVIRSFRIEQKKIKVILGLSFRSKA